MIRARSHGADPTRGITRNRRGSWAAAVLVPALLILPSCAVNPATGKRQIALIGEDREIDIGREQDEQIVGTLGVYGGPELDAWVQGVGNRLAAASERPDLPWTFRVVDDPAVNAFALPGGFIYVTRGILAYLDSEAELAGVLGHEIGHVTARHSVNQISKAQIASLGLGLGMVFSDSFRQFGNLAESGLGLVFLKYSRDDERQADNLGVRYAVREGYDPGAMVGVFEMLERVSGSSEAGRVPSWLATHPQPLDRRDRIRDRIERLGSEARGGTLGKETYAARVDGIVFGPDPREGYFRETTFYHPDLKFRFEFPPGWRTANEKTSVSGTADGGDAMVVTSLAAEPTARQALARFLERDGVTGGDGWRDRIGGFPAASRYFAASASGNEIRGLVAFVEDAGRVYRLLGFATSSSWAGHEGRIQTALASFARLDDPRFLEVVPARLGFVETDRETTLEDLARIHAVSVDLETLARLNRVDPGARLPRGTYKIVTGGEIP